MKPQFFIAITFGMVLAGCKGDVKTSSELAEPKETYCEKLCDCEGCSEFEYGECTDDLETTANMAESEGCKAPYMSYLGCVEGGSCNNGSWDVDGCNDTYAALMQCLNPTPSCPTTGDGVCDEPEGTGKCAEGTDAPDCDEPPPPPCATISNGVCDEPEGTNTCPEGSDQADCSVAPSSCETYCNTIQSNCTGANAQYPDKATCLATCAAIPAGTLGDMEGNSVACRTYHSGAAQMDSAAHCVHAGPSGGGICGDYCESFCAVVPLVCPDVYLTAKECMFECSMFPNGEPYDASDTTGDTLACRFYHATIASVDPAAHCSHINEASPVCK